jgi:hypothetical protein
MNCTAIAGATLAQFGGYDDLTPFVSYIFSDSDSSDGTCREVRNLGWDPKPTRVASAFPQLRARLKMSPFFTLLGLASSVIFFGAAAFLIRGSPRSREKSPRGMLLMSSQTSALSLKLETAVHRWTTLVARCAAKFVFGQHIEECDREWPGCGCSG